MDIDIDDGIPIIGWFRKWKMKIERLKDNEYWNKRKVNTFRRRASGQDYPSPMIVLDSKYKDLIGKYYATFTGKAVCTNILSDKEVRRIEGDCIVLFFGNNWKMKGNGSFAKRGV